MLPVCDHYSGVETRMRKSLQLQADMTDEFGSCVFDVTLDCEDGAPVGGEADHAEMIVQLLDHSAQAPDAIAKRRVGVRVHAVDHPHFLADLDIILKQAGQCLAYVTVPKVDTPADVKRVVDALDQEHATTLPLHVLIESALGVRNAFDIAAHPRVESLSFGLMDFVSSHGGAIPASGMSSQGQFTHPLVVRAKLDIASACHASGKTPSHCVVTEFKNPVAMADAARQAFQEFGYIRMWSIHPDQIRPILTAFMPEAGEIELASQIIAAGARNDWAPVSFKGQLHDRASYRYYWQVLERAHRAGGAMPPESQTFF